MDDNYLRNVLGSATREATWHARNEEQGSSVSVSMREYHRFKTSPRLVFNRNNKALFLCRARFQLLNTDSVLFQHVSPVHPAKTSLHQERSKLQLWWTWKRVPWKVLRIYIYSTGLFWKINSLFSKVHDSISTRLSVFDCLLSSAQTQWSSVAPSNDNFSISTFKQVSYRKQQQEALSVSDQLTVIEHRLPSVPMQWSSSVSIEDCREKQRLQSKNKNG